MDLIWIEKTKRGHNIRYDINHPDAKDLYVISMNSTVIDENSRITRFNNSHASRHLHDRVVIYGKNVDSGTWLDADPNSAMVKSARKYLETIAKGDRWPHQSRFSNAQNQNV